MADVAVITEEQLRAAVRCDQAAFDTIEDGFRALHEGRVVMPPIMHLSVADQNGDVDVKSAYIAGSPVVAVKIAAGFSGNPLKQLPFSSGMVVVIDATTGRPLAVFLDNGYLTDLRTGLAGAVAAHHLGRPNAVRVGIIGSGVQARYQLEALCLTRTIKEVLIWGRTAVSAERCADEVAGALGLDVTVCPRAEDAVRNCDIVITTTPSAEPIVDVSWLSAGQHITAVGSDLPGKRELGEGVIEAADVVTCDALQSAQQFGELQWTDAKALKTPIAELGSIIAGETVGRQSLDDITVTDLVGLGVQDAAIAHYAAKQLGLVS